MYLLYSCCTEFIKMIIYKDDWKFYPDAIADIDTKNTSYVRYAAQLERMGIKNNLFHLSLLDKDLVGVNPHDPDLDDQMKIKIIREVSTNFWYFIREVIKIPTTGSIVDSPYSLNRLNAGFHWLYLQNISTFLMAIRQCGKSLCADVHHVAYLDIYCRNYPIDVIVNSSTLRQSSTDKRIALRKTIPSYLTYRTPTGMRHDKENTEGIECKKLNNLIRCHLASDKEDGAKKMGRGLTSSCRQIDEGPHCKNIHMSLGIAEMGGAAAIRSAKENGTPYGTCITTTPGDTVSPEGQFMYDIYCKAMPWTEALYDCKNYDEVMKTITMQTRGESNMVNITMYHTNLGFSDEWLASEILRVRATPEDIEKDMLLKWDNGSLLCPLDKETLFRITQGERDPIYTGITPYHYVCRWYCKKEEINSKLSRGKYILSLDPSELAGNDIHGLTLVDTKDMSVVMACSPNEGNTFTFAKWIFEFLMKHQNVTFVAEAKSTGRPTIDTLIVLFVKAGLNPLKRIYHTLFEHPELAKTHERLIQSKEALGSVDLYSSLKKYIGISTDKKIRETLYSNLLVTIGEDFGHNIRDREVAMQIKSLVIIKGRVDHPPKGHDDLVISWLLAAYILRMSTNLWYYGISPNDILKDRYIDDSMSDAVRKQKTMTYEEEVIFNYKQKRIKTELNELFERYQNSTDINEQIIIEAKIKNLYNDVVDSEVDMNSFDGLLTSIKQNKDNNKLLNTHRKKQFIDNIYELFNKS